MNKVEYNQTEGFPLDVNILDFGQKANQISQELGHIIAPLAIVSGCTENSNNISDGVVFIEGELLPFKGGLRQENIRVVEEIEKREFENGVQKDVLITRFATFGIGAVKTYKWSDFHRPKTLKALQSEKAEKNILDNLIERVNKLEVLARPLSDGGSMMFWNKPANQIPIGWKEAENWREKIPMSWNPDKALFAGIGNTGGNLEQTIQLAATGWSVGAAIAGGSKPSGQLVVTNGQREIGESFESISNATGFKSSTISTLSPYRIVIFIEPIL